MLLSAQPQERHKLGQGGELQRRRSKDCPCGGRLPPLPLLSLFFFLSLPPPLVFALFVCSLFRLCLLTPFLSRFPSASSEPASAAASASAAAAVTRSRIELLAEEEEAALHPHNDPHHQPQQHQHQQRLKQQGGKRGQRGAGAATQWM